MFDVGTYEIVFQSNGTRGRLPLLFATDDDRAIELALLFRGHETLGLLGGPVSDDPSDRSQRFGHRTGDG